MHLSYNLPLASQQATAFIDFLSVLVPDKYMH